MLVWSGRWTKPWTYLGSHVPKPGGENTCLNLRLFGGPARTNGKNGEVMIDRFGRSS